MDRKGKLFLIMAFFALAAFLLGGPASGQEARDYFKVGVITSLTGELTKGGYMTKRGYDLWEHMVNKQGGFLIKGKRYKVRLVYVDPASDPAKAARAAERLVTVEKVDFVLGPYSSMVTLGAAPIFEKYKMPHITGSAESDLIWQKHFDWTFTFLAPTDRGARGGITALASVTPKPKTAALITADDAFSRTCADALKDEAMKHGIELTLFEIFPVGTVDFSPLVSKVKAKNPDVFVVSGHPDHHISAIRSAKSLDFNPKAYVVHWLSGDLWRELKQDADYILGTTMWTPEAPYEGPLFKDSQSYRELFEVVYAKGEPDYSEAGTAACGVALQIALQEAGLTPPLDANGKEIFKNQLEKLETETFFSPVNFSTEKKYWHTNIGINMITLQIQNAEPVAIYPPQVKKKAVIYPTPKWKER